MDDPEKIERKLVEAELLRLINDGRELRGEAPAATFPEPPFCSFCARGKNEVNGMIEGISAHICDACVLQASLLFRTKR